MRVSPFGCALEKKRHFLRAAACAKVSEVRSPIVFVTCCVLGFSCELGCSSRRRLTDIRGPLLSLTIPDPSGTAVVHVLSSDSGLRARGPCKLPAPDASATLNGVSLERQRGKYATDDLAFDLDCIVAFSARGATVRRTGASAVLRLADDSVTWTLELPTAFSPRSFSLTTPSNGVLRRGQRVVIRWSRTDDQIDPRGIGFELYRSGDEPGTGTVLREVEVRGDELAFTIPDDARQSWTGPAFLRFLGSASVAPASKGYPVEQCIVNLSFSVPPIAVTVEN